MIGRSSKPEADFQFVIVAVARGKEMAVDAQDVRRRMLAQFGIRIEPQMSQYVLDQLGRAAAADASFPVMGGDARTGAPVRRFIPAAAFIDSASGATSASSVTH